MQNNYNFKTPFYKRIMEMECRKDIITENRGVNKKNRSSVQSLFARYSNYGKQNKFRLMYLFGFCVIFNMGFLYDIIFEKNNIYSRIINKLTLKIYPPTINEQSELKINQNSQKVKQLGNIFIQMDKTINQIKPQLISQLLNNKMYDKDFVDIQQFIHFFIDQDIQTLKLKLKITRIMN